MTTTFKEKYYTEKYYQTGLLWKTDHTTLPKNRDLAEKRLYSLERKLEKNPVLEQNHTGTMNQYFVNGYARKMAEQESRNISKITNFLPHHSVVNPKMPEKIRAVFHASTKLKNISLSDHLLRYPNLLNNLILILICFHMGKDAVTADIAQMFYQIKLRHSDQDSLRFLWRASKFENSSDYVITVHLFRKNNSLCCANYYLKKCVSNQSKIFEKHVTECAENDFYMDDFLKSNCSRNKLLTLSVKLIEMFSTCSFCLTKWFSNSNKIIKSFPKSEMSPKFLNYKEKVIERVLCI